MGEGASGHLRASAGLAALRVGGRAKVQLGARDHVSAMPQKRPSLLGFLSAAASAVGKATLLRHFTLAVTLPRDYF